MSMKVMEKLTGSLYEIAEMGMTIILCDPITGQKLEMGHRTFKKSYTFIDEESLAITKPSLEDELEMADRKVKEIITGVEESQKPSTSVRIDFTVKERNEKKQNKEKSKKQKDLSTATSLKDICDSLKIDCSKARKILRNKKVDKPGGSWEWQDPKAIEKIKELLRK